MKRAAVLIGVDRTGDLPGLKDAAKGARRMETWARAQAMSPVEVITDENDGTVDVGQVKKAIKKIVDAGTVEQLVIYFAGHGVNIRYGEYWLLSDAPGDTQAAVNVQSSAVLAQFSGIPHVVLISDSCRTAAEGIRAQLVTGSEIFPNLGAGDLEKPVDQFFACTLGRPAHEIRDPSTTAKEFTALYTQALLDALLGSKSDLLDWAEEEAARIGYIRPRPLKAYLESEVSRRIGDLKLQTKVIQVPDARITSDQDAWISRLEREQTPSPGRPPAEAAPGIVPPRAPTAATISTSLLRPVLAGDLAGLAHALDEVRLEDAGSAPGLADIVEMTATPFGPQHHETQCGFKVRGARISDVFSPKVKAELFEGGEAVRIHGNAEPRGASVLLIFENGTGVTLPAIPEFLTALTVEDGELVDVAYEPSDNTWRWEEFEKKAAEVRALRAVASSSTGNGVFRLEGEDALEVARRMQLAKGVDPTLAVYAAYAYQNLQRRDLIREMSRYMRDDLGAPLFDVALLAHELDGRALGADDDVLSFMPLLSEGWSLLPAHRVSLAPSLEGIHQNLVSSVWTLFDAAGVERLRAALGTGEVR